MRKKYKIIFLSLAQNCASTLKNYFNFLERFPKSYKIKIIIAENNSKDNTREIIENYSKTNKDVTLLKTDFLNSIDERILRITRGRDFLQKYIIKYNLNSDFICVIDLDDVIKKKINFKNFIKVLRHLKKNKNKLNGISVKTNPYYYDILALKCQKFKTPNILKIQREKNILSAYSIRKKYIYSLQKKLNTEKKLYTISSFNGLCVYNYKDFIKGNYFYGENNKKRVNFNEHIKFNTSLNNLNGKFIQISDQLFLSTPKEHLPASSFINFWFNRIFLRK